MSRVKGGTVTHARHKKILKSSLKQFKLAESAGSVVLYGRVKKSFASVSVLGPQVSKTSVVRCKPLSKLEALFLKNDHIVTKKFNLGSPLPSQIIKCGFGEKRNMSRIILIVPTAKALLVDNKLSHQS